MTARKPKAPYGSPCNSCGECCVKVQCPLSLGLFGAQSLCPALQRGTGVDLVCGLVVEPEKFVDEGAWPMHVMAEAFRLIVGAGIGCDAQGESDNPALVRIARPRLIAAIDHAITRASPEAKRFVRYLQGAEAA